MKSNLFSLKSFALICIAVVFFMANGFAQNCEPTTKVVKKEGTEVKNSDKKSENSNKEEKKEPALTVKLTNVADPKKNLVQSSTVTITDTQFTTEKEVEIKDANTPYYWPSEKPVYIDGNNELYIAAGKVHYPDELKKDKVQGIVVVQVTIEKDGSITNPIVVAPVHSKLDEEALKAVAKLKCFIPAKHNGEVVRSYFTIPVPFLLDIK
jgi:TonB family protein